MQVSEGLLVSLLDGAPDAMLCVAADGRIALVNVQAERMFGYRRAELVGRPVETLVPGAATTAHAAHRARYTADPKPRMMGATRAFPCRRRDGSTFPAEISLSAVGAPDGTWIMAAVRDVTERLALLAECDQLRGQAERHRLERERLHAQARYDKLERQLHRGQRLESLGELAGGVAHDFNNLLAVISNYAAFVSEEVAKDISEVSWRCVRDDVAQIQLAAQRAAAVTHQLLAFARREVVQLRPLNLNEVIKDAEQLLTATLGEHVVLSTDLAPDLCPVLADAGQIGQVLVNLAVNARDAMPSSGTLTVTTAAADIEIGHPELEPGRYACVKVSDTGVGMARDVIDHAFEPFFTTKPKGEGTGLGLATVYGIITQARGQVHVSSEPGVGTTFTILLPAAGRDPVPGQSPAQVPGAGAGETILVVEDEPAMREVTRRILCRNGYKVVTACNGREAVEIAADRDADIDVLLTDMVMPHMLGKEAAERIRALRPGVKVLFMSGYAQGQLDSHGVVAADVNLIEKPFTEKSLLAKLRQVITGDETLPPPRRGPCDPGTL